MTAKHDVTVYDRAPATAAVSASQFEAYLRRTGWTQTSGVVAGGRIWIFANCAAVYVYPDLVDASEVECVAEAEGRQPSAVLADIAEDQP